MLTERDQAIKNVLLDYVGGPASFVGPNKALGCIDPDYLRMARRRMMVNKRRMTTFTLLYVCVVLTAVAVVTATTSNYNVMLWVAVGTFNAVNAAIHYSEYQKKKMAFAVFDILKNDSEEGGAIG